MNIRELLGTKSRIKIRKILELKEETEEEFNCRILNDYGTKLDKHIKENSEENSEEKRE